MTLPALVDEKTRQRLDGQLAQPLTLDQEPGLERFGLDAQAVQELSPVERDGSLERLPVNGRRGCLERGDVHLDSTGLEGGGIAVEPKRWR